jgi:DNA-binding transcriptional ArsR family regulator
MTPPLRAQLNRRTSDEVEDLVFKALANPTRRAILMMIHDRGMFVTSKEIAVTLEADHWQAISRHLSVLTEAGLLELNVQGREHAYGLVEGHAAHIAGRWLDRLNQVGTRNTNGTLVFEPLPDT